MSLRPAPDIVGVTRRLRILHRVAITVAGAAIAACLLGNLRLALAAVILVLFLQLFALEGLRVLAASTREPR